MQPFNNYNKIAHALIWTNDIPASTGVNDVPQGAKNDLSYTVYAKPTSNNRDIWVLALDQLGYKSHYATDSTTQKDGWP